MHFVAVEDSMDRLVAGAGEGDDVDGLVGASAAGGELNAGEKGERDDRCEGARDEEITVTQHGRDHSIAPAARQPESSARLATNEDRRPPRGWNGGPSRPPLAQWENRRRQFGCRFGFIAQGRGLPSGHTHFFFLLLLSASAAGGALPPLPP